MKKEFIFAALTLLLMTNAYAVDQLPSGLNTSNLENPVNTQANYDPNNILLPSPYPIYTNGSTVINHSMPGFTRKDLPTNNDYQKNPGCYIACYSHDASNGIYAVGGNIYMNGQVRVAGIYSDRICVPTGFDSGDISQAAKFKQLCSSAIKSCANGNCWAGGDTGGWYGIQ